MKGDLREGYESQKTTRSENYLLLFIFIIFGLGSFQPMEELSARLQSDPLAVLLLGVVILLPLQESVLRGRGNLEDQSKTRATRLTSDIRSQS